MEEIWGMMRPQVFLDVFDNALAFITGRLHDVHRQPCGGLLQRGGPGRGGAVLGILLDHNEIGDRLNGDQTRLRMKGLILADGNRFEAHACGQALPFRLTKLHHRLFQSRGDPLLRAVGSRHKMIEAGEFQKQAN
jgi:hypothetical protein